MRATWVRRLWLSCFLLLAFCGSALAQVSVTISPATLEDGAVGLVYGDTLTASGAVPPYTFSVASGTLPPGLTLAPDGDLGGTPTTVGVYSFMIMAEDADATSNGFASYTVEIFPEATIEPDELGTAQVGVPYEQQVSVVDGGAPSYVFSIQSGALPPGMSLASDGWITGTPNVPGDATFTIQATPGFLVDELFAPTAAPVVTLSRSYTMSVVPAPIIVAPAVLPDATLGHVYNQTITVSGGTAPYAFTVSGSLPPGLTLLPNGTLVGIPGALGSYPFVIHATDSLGATGGQAYNVFVDAEEFRLVGGNPPNGTVDVPYTHDLEATGGWPPYYFYAETGLPPGLVLEEDGELHGTPEAAGTYPFEVYAYDGSEASASRIYTIIIEDTLPLAVDDEAETPTGQAVAIAVTANDSGDFDSIAIASPPVHGSVAVDALEIEYQPVEGFIGDDSFTYTLAGPGGTSSPATVVVHVLAPAAPVAVDDEATTSAGQAVAIAVTANDSGAFDTIAIASSPAHGSVALDGLEVEYQPIGTYVGDDSFTYTLSGPGGTSSPATVMVHVDALPAPVGVPQALSTQAGVPVSFDAAAGASGGPITAVAIVEPPTSGSATVAGTHIEYTPAVDAVAGMVIPVTYTLANAYGVSAPVTSTITIEAAPLVLPTATALEATTERGVPVGVELTTGATGGPFIAAEVLSLSPQDSGTTAVAASPGGYLLTYTPSENFIGVAVASFTLGNADGTSEPATVTITVTERDSPADDPEVGGLTGAQVQVVRSFASSQILNVINRLETLHEPGKPLSFWIGGSIRKGDSPGREFETSGMSGGADYRFSDKFAFGGGLGYGRDRTMTGNKGSRSDATAKTGMGYASYRPSLPWFIDMVSGYQRITFQLRRFVTDTGDMLEAPRDGTQAFSSWSSGYEKKGEKWMFSTYGRMDVAQAKLDEYSENGDPLHALSFGEQSIETRTSTLGVRGKYKRKIPWGTLEPRFRVELQRDFHDESGAAISYSDLQSGPVYVLPGEELDRSRYIIEIGTIFKSRWGFVMRLDYRGVRGGMYDDDNAIMFSFQDDH